MIASRILKSLKEAHEREINSVISQLLPVKMPRNDEPDIIFLERETVMTLDNPMTIHW